MDKEKLIAEVFRRPALWDKRDRRHHNRYILDKNWNEISNCLSTSRVEVQNKWKALRQNFKKHLDKAREMRSGDQAPDDFECDWPYFQSLLFLTDQFTPRESDTNLKENTPVIDNHTDINSDPEEFNASTPVPSPQTSEASISLNKRVSKRIRPNEEIGKDLVAIEKEKLTYLKNKQERTAATNQVIDKDLSFFQSMIPQVKTLDARKKMEFRMDVQKLLFDYCFGCKSNMVSTSTTSTPVWQSGPSRYQHYNTTSTPVWQSGPSRYQHENTTSTPVWQSGPSRYQHDNIIHEGGTSNTENL